MKTILMLVLLNTTTGTKTTIEVPMKDFGTCLEYKKASMGSPIPKGHVVQQFECIVGAE